MMVSSTTPIKKRKRSTAPDGTKKNKKRLKVNNVPELILCAKQLKSDVKEEDDVYEPILQSEIRNSVYLCQSIKSEPCDLDVDHKSVKIKVKKKKKKSTSTKERVTHLTKELISEDNSLVFNEVKVELHSSIDKMLVKDEPVTPEKLLVKVEPSNFGTLFQSNIKQELEEIDDAIDEFVLRKLSFNPSDSCIEKYQSTLHCAIPPQFINNIQAGIKAQLATLHLKYLESEQGVLLKNTKIKLKERTASIVSISPELHFDIFCSITVFKPKFGAVLEGTIVKFGPGYVNCLVYGYFTAVVYDRFSEPVDVGSVIRFKLQFFQVTVHNDFILKGVPVT